MEKVMTAPGAGAAGKTADKSESYEEVTKRVNDVLGDITAGRVIRPQRKLLSDALDRASSGDKVNDAIGRSR
jgi:hypothetical protein